MPGMKKRLSYFGTFVAVFFALMGSLAGTASARTALVFQSDFGLRDGSVACMKGVAFGVDASLPIFDITHEIPEYSIWDASYRLLQTVGFWPAGTVFVSVVDPGVGTDRRSVVAKTRSGHYIVTPDNGTLTFIESSVGLEEVRTIDETRYRRPGSEQSYTFYGRDLYALAGAKLASGAISFADVGPVLSGPVVRIPHRKAEAKSGVLFGTIPVIDVRYGNVWSTIGKPLFDTLKPVAGAKFEVTILNDGKEVYRGVVPYANTFGDVPEGEPLLYLNSMMNLSLALNMSSFAEEHGISSGPEWSVVVRPEKK
jgi:S-adenosylmethionine hydrolase